MTSVDFLSDSFVPQQWNVDPRFGIQPVSLFLGSGHYGLEVAVAQCLGTPTRAGLLGAWRFRKGSRAAPLLLVVRRPEGVTVCGAAGPEPPIFTVEDASQVEGRCREALGQPDIHSALQLLSSTLASLETAVSGFWNEGFLAQLQPNRGFRRWLRRCTGRDPAVVGALSGVPSTPSAWVARRARCGPSVHPEDRR